MDNVILFAADHNGVELKRHLIRELVGSPFRCIDLGPFDGTRPVDYCDYASQAARIVSAHQAGRAVLICGTGVGMSIAANRVAGARAALVHNLVTAVKCREHNDANVLCLGSWITAPDAATEILSLWLRAAFGEGRHVPRVAKMGSAERSHVVLTYGVFDLLNPAHVALLNFARTLGGRLVVGINSDRAVAQLRGPGRPIHDERDRQQMVGSIEAVDEVVVFDDTSPSDLVRALRPDVVVKGDVGRSVEEIRRLDGIPDAIPLKIFPRLARYSSRTMVTKILAHAS
jgi:ribose 5-phosphate isomerase B